LIGQLYHMLNVVNQMW